MACDQLEPARRGAFGKQRCPFVVGRRARGWGGDVRVACTHAHTQAGLWTITFLHAYTWYARGKRLRQCETLGSDRGSQVVGSNVRAQVLSCGTMPCTSCFSPAPRPSTLSTVCVCARAFPVYTMLGSVPTMQVPARVSPCQPCPESRVFCATATAALCATTDCHSIFQSTCLSAPIFGKDKTIADFCQARMLGPNAGACAPALRCMSRWTKPRLPRRAALCKGVMPPTSL